MLRCNRLRFALAWLAAMAGLAAPAAAQEAQDRATLGLMGTIPIYWGEAAGIDEVLAGTARPHWARRLLERDFALVPLDYLSPEMLEGQSNLLMAQPRGLGAEENVALDAWVRGGGRLVLVVDPLLTGESRFTIGDRRRPQDVALLSPILAHWGLELVFDPAQPTGPRQVDHFGMAIPVEMRGELRPRGDADYCTIPGDGLLAHCVIGAGQAMVVADAALLDLDGPAPHAEAALTWLVEHIFAPIGDDAGSGGDSRGPANDAGENTDGAARRGEVSAHPGHRHGGE